MPWFAWVAIVYTVVDRLWTVAWIGRAIDITPSFAVTSLITGALWVLVIVELAT